MISHGIVASAFTYQNSDQDFIPAVVQLQNESVLNDQDHNVASMEKASSRLAEDERSTQPSTTATTPQVQSANDDNPFPDPSSYIHRKRISRDYFCTLKSSGIYHLRVQHSNTKQLCFT